MQEVSGPSPPEVLVEVSFLESVHDTYGHSLVVLMAASSHQVVADFFRKWAVVLGQRTNWKTNFIKDVPLIHLTFQHSSFIPRVLEIPWVSNSGILRWGLDAVLPPCFPALMLVIKHAGGITYHRGESASYSSPKPAFLMVKP